MYTVYRLRCLRRSSFTKSLTVRLALSSACDSWVPLTDWPILLPAWAWRNASPRPARPFFSMSPAVNEVFCHPNGGAAGAFGGDEVFSLFSTITWSLALRDGFRSQWKSSTVPCFSYLSLVRMGGHCKITMTYLWRHWSMSCTWKIKVLLKVHPIQLSALFMLLEDLVIIDTGNTSLFLEKMARHKWLAQNMTGQVSKKTGLRIHLHLT